MRRCGHGEAYRVNVGHGVVPVVAGAVVGDVQVDGASQPGREFGEWRHTGGDSRLDPDAGGRVRCDTGLGVISSVTHRGLEAVDVHTPGPGLPDREGVGDIMDT